MRGIQQHGSAAVDGEAEEGHSRLTSVLARHQGQRLWCCGHNLPLEEETKVTDTMSVCEKEHFPLILTCCLMLITVFSTLEDDRTPVLATVLATFGPP